MPSKIKLLLVGTVQGNIQVLADKLKSLQSSKAGPFDVCFVVGRFLSSSENDDTDSSTLLKAIEELPIPVYLQKLMEVMKRLPSSRQRSHSVLRRSFLLR